MLILNDTDQPVTYSHSGPGGGDEDCKDAAKSEPIPQRSYVTDNTIPVEDKICFFDKEGKFIDDTEFILFNDFLAILKGKDARLYYNDRFCKAVFHQLLGLDQTAIVDIAADIARGNRD